MTNYYIKTTNKIDFSVIKHLYIKTYGEVKANLLELSVLHGGNGFASIFRRLTPEVMTI
jgi:hypothetical protein